MSSPLILTEPTASLSSLQNASLSSTVWPDPHAIVPCLSWTTAATVFTTVRRGWGWDWGVGAQLYGTVPLFLVLHAHLQGLLSEAVQWPVLHEQLMSSRQSHGKLWQLLTTHVRVGMIVCTCLVCVCVHMCELFFLTEQVPPLHVRDRCSSAEEQGEWAGAETRGRSTNWSKLLTTYRCSFDMMYSLLNYSTHLKHFCKPLSGTAAIFLTAKQDSYVPREDCVTSVWPGERWCYY